MKSLQSKLIELRAGGLEILQVAVLAKLPWLVHGFSTRTGGTSRLEGSPDGQGVLNLGFTSWDTRENVLVNRTKLLSALRAGQMNLLTLRQIHSDVVHVLDAFLDNVPRALPPHHPGAPRDLPQDRLDAPRGDAGITRAQGWLLGVQTADCVPVLMVDTRQHAVAAVHAGWRGTLRRIAAKTLGRMQMAFGTRPEDVVAVLGPAIGRCCYEVGPEVAQTYAGQFAQAREWFDGPFDQLAPREEPNALKWLSMTPPGHNPPPRVRLDLRAANRWQLLDAGVKASNIISSELCTSCRTDLFFSYRHEHARTGRLMAIIGLRER